MPGLTTELSAQGIDFVRFVWCDNANVPRAKVVPIGFLKQAYSRGVGLSFAQQAVPVTQDAFVAESGLGPVGEVRLVADWSSIVKLPFAPNHARVFGNMMHRGQPWSHCPRNFLRSVINRATSLGLQFQVAFENEFYLLESSGSGHKPVDETLFCSLYGLDQNLEVFEEIITNLNLQGTRVVGFHPESGGGQCEIAIHHADPMTAADQQIGFRETVHAVARRRDLRASFLPKPFADRAGSGCHIHLSLWSDGKNISDPGSKDQDTAKHFISGLLTHLPALMALTTPSPNSFARLGRHLWSGAFGCWGYDNREAAIRVPSQPGGASHFEFKTHDATANPYLALGGLLAAGLDGVEKKLSLPEPIEVDPGLLDKKELKKRGIKELPTDLPSTLKSLDKCQPLKDALGPDLLRSYLAVKREEANQLSKMDLPDALELLLCRY